MGAPSGNGRVLGQAVEYPRHYDPDLLVPIPRAQGRAELGLGGGRLPFQGADVWNAFELSWLDTQGRPLVARGRFVVPCDSPNLVESKSLKLYLNSLNQHRCDSPEDYRALVEKDLGAAAGAPVQVVVQPFSGMQEVLEAPDGVCLDKFDTACEDYTVNPALLSLADPDAAFEEVVEEILYTDVFRSLCPVTGQPDWATVVICYKGSRIDPGSLLRYLVSFREHQGFHENCVERIFCDIREHCRPQQLGIEANFLRRGGLDINPVRSSDDSVNYMLLPRYNRQ